VANEFSAKQQMALSEAEVKVLLIDCLRHSPDVVRPRQMKRRELVLSLRPLISNSMSGINELNYVLFIFSVYRWKNRDRERLNLHLLQIQSNKYLERN